MVKPLRIIMGPCAIESRDHAMLMAEYVSKLTQSLQKDGFNIELIYKSCFNKANRTSVTAFHGVGMEEGLSILSEVKERFGLKVISDIHTVEEAEAAGKIVDIIQIPHSLSRYTFIIQAAARTGKSLAIKKGLFMSPDDILNAVTKVRAAGNNEEVIFVERGNSFGYDSVIVDMRNFKKYKRIISGSLHKVVSCIDATHPSQDSKYAGELALAGVAAGADMVFMEIHNDPHNALCDGPCSIHTDKVEALVRKLYAVYLIINS